MRRFFLKRDVDESGISGLGRVADGCQFDSGWCSLTWKSELLAMSWYPSVEAIIKIHGHHGATHVVWVDDEI